ncbi:MAG: response regulator [Muribaculaceae bacterium]|nr:response regulator [Muribaculaceae bacterium]
MILIVDDDKSIRLSISLMLKQAGLEFEAVSTEDEAMAAVRRPDVELVILDMNLTLATTGRQGIDMLQGIRILAPEVPVIMLSAWATVPLAVEGMSHGAVDFVTKPWSNRDFMAKIRTALKRAEESAARTKAVDTLDNTEREAIAKALKQTDGNLSDAARLLGITRQSLYRRMEKFGLKA